MKTNLDVYSNELFNNWGQNSEKTLIKAEHEVLTKYCTNKKAKVIEAGTGGGRISFNLEKLGFTDIDAFDFVPKMIDEAKRNSVKQNSNVNFYVADATDLSGFSSANYDYAVYLQQIISFIPFEKMEIALQECYRILNDEGTCIFSFLNYSGRKYNKHLSFLVNSARLIRGEKISKQKLPWLKLGNKTNWRFLSKNQAGVYWLTEEQITQMMERTGFVISDMIDKGSILYFVCKKR